MSRAGWAIDIDRDDITRADLVEGVAAPLAPGQVRVHLDSYAMTANNITYAVFGKPAGLFGPDKNGRDQGYWDFFAERGEPGRLPVWGFATVTESAVDGVAVGDRYYGYYPMASDAVLTVGKAGPGGFTDVTPRRTTLPPIYNNYQRIEALADYRAADHNYWPVFRPLFLTGWLIADQFEDDGDYGAEQILIASASSKTAIGLGFSIAQRAGHRPETIGLTSKANVASLAEQGIYDRVIAYDDIMTLNPGTPSALVDMAGNGAVTRAVHSHFGHNLKASIIVGKSHWDADAGEAPLPGPERQGFFAPGRSQKRIADWGGAAFGQKIAEAWLGFMDVAPRLTAIDKRQGSEAALAAYHDMLAGRTDPKAGIVVEP
ncbi:DUF2855 family protein [Sphingopyxis macrogoltabida]|uniref:DUF2855 domain-containing protein n=1 Tax=Sphingopyxis macrogoltabida TaxID=33050 RepID=A0AAC8YX88_SPHMC|nr:DUF2855 family protein [Sphingopyxis macrogoltabida]ALJ11617.1 hypothetical protein LH19_01945 [Sphingopyxis macrogoltabida]AMU87806.1 hypothetical protein ATM17_01925 [Sphingopyxis macrogoltabida]